MVRCGGKTRLLDTAHSGGAPAGVGALAPSRCGAAQQERGYRGTGLQACRSRVQLWPINQPRAAVLVGLVWSFLGGLSAAQHPCQIVQVFGVQVIAWLG